MRGFCNNLEQLTETNGDFRRVLYTGKHSQLVLMALGPGEEIGLETHEGHDQFFRFESGTGVVVIDDNEYVVEDGFGVIVPAGAVHNVKNTGSETLKLYTIYSPAEHKDKTVHPTKADASEEHFDGVTTE